MKIVILFLITTSWVLNAAADSIDHRKGGATLFELWHLIKFASYSCVIIPLMAYAGFDIWQVLITVLIMWFCWELTYQWFNYCELWRFDDKVNIPFIRWIWKIKEHR